MVLDTFVVSCRGPVTLKRFDGSVVVNPTREDIRGTRFRRVFGFRAV